MADDSYTPAKLLEFLRGAPAQGLLNPAVARARANAIEALFTVLTAEEREDLRCVDVERLAGRVHKLEDSTIRPEGVELYRTRVHEALVDYFAWLDNPKTFATVGGHNLRRELRGFVSGAADAEESRALEDIALATSDRRRDFIPVPLREDVPLTESVDDLEWRGAHRDRVEALCATFQSDEL